MNTYIVLSQASMGLFILGLFIIFTFIGGLKKNKSLANKITVYTGVFLTVVSVITFIVSETLRYRSLKDTK
jgi:uncharacterized membrane protein YhaH (DUF805 family)